MSESVVKFPKPKKTKSEFTKLAVEAMREAQKNAAREYARYGLKLAVEKSS